VRAFDNLYYVGLTEIGAWAVTTSEASSSSMHLVQMRRAATARQHAQVGLDPAQIKIVIVTHAHSDHGGGAKYLQDKFGARIAMSAQDWMERRKRPGGPNNIPGATS